MHRIKAAILGSITAVMGVVPIAAQSPRLSDDERAILFPTTASLSEDGSAWEVPIHGWVFEPEADGLVRRRMIDSIRSALGVQPNGSEAEVLRRRLGWFVVDNERGKRLDIAVSVLEKTGGTRPLPYTLTLPATDADGHTRALARIPASLDGGEPPVAIVLRITNPSEEQSELSVIAPLIGAEGLSVISDIDDTMKVSRVTDKKQLLRLTFLLEFEPAAGMAEFYRKLAAEHGAAFHLVSSSPWQLQPELAGMIERADFPRAEFHLKEFRAKDTSVLDLFADPLETKPPLIEAILDRWPKRRFILIGDSGEADPEVYGRIAAARPEQVIAIYIRDVTEQKRDDPRYAEAFKDIEPEKWHLFTDPSELPVLDKLPGDVEE